MSDSSETASLMKPENLQLNIESLRLQTMSMFASMKSRVGLETLRSLPMFLGLNTGTGLCISVGSFTPPMRKVDKHAPEKIKSRMQLNLAFFLTNYVLVAAMVALVVTMMYPSSIIVIGIVYAIWNVHAYLIRNEVDLFGVQVHSLLTIQQRFYINFVITFILVVWKCLVPCLVILTISWLLIGFHAVLRDPKHIESTSSQILDDYDEEDMEGGRSVENGSDVMQGRGEDN